MLWSGRSGCLNVCFELKKGFLQNFIGNTGQKSSAPHLGTLWLVAVSHVSTYPIHRLSMDAYDISQQQHRLNNDNSDDDDDDDYGNYSNDGEDCENCGDNEEADDDEDDEDEDDYEDDLT